MNNEVPLQDDFEDLIHEHGSALRVGKFTFTGWTATLIVCVAVITVPLAVVFAVGAIL